MAILNKEEEELTIKKMIALAAAKMLQNRGVRNKKGAIYPFVDDGVLPMSGWLKQQQQQQQHRFRPILRCK
jgi:hypothetical protein